MRNLEVQKLVDAIETVHGPITLYGSDANEEHGTCFKVSGVDATFSVHTQGGSLPSDQYDIQIESVPPGDYVFTSVVSLEEFLTLVAMMEGPQAHWPGVEKDV